MVKPIPSLTHEQAQRFWAKVQKTETCWNWTACLVQGYGQVGIGAKQYGAHRVSYVLMFGEIPDGLHIDHLCRNRRCVNPAHMELVTNAENTRRGDGLAAMNLRKQHCIHGHPFSGNNVRVGPYGYRDCRACKQVRKRAYRVRRGATP